MKVSENWLRDWVNPAAKTEELASLLTMAGLEVDACNPVAGSFEGVIVAEIIDCRPHPEADKLSLCQVNNGRDQTLKIVCGASNVRKGMKVALAQIGARMPSGLVIKEAKLRGELSQGMLCSLSELGLSDHSEGIMDLDEDAPLGCDLREYLQLDDFVLDIDLTPNRADCLSVLGVAREISVLTESLLKPLPKYQSPELSSDTKEIYVADAKACPRFCGRVLRGLSPDIKAPLWMRERLRRAGLRSIHPVVDVTNYVMLELGQPLHAYDLNKLEGNIHVRYARQGESLELLDGQKVALKENHLLIADDNKPLGLAGVMGGKSSAVDEQTTDIFLESAYFNPATIAGVARSYGLFTDASQRFERGVDPALAEMALERATELLLDIYAGKAGPLTEVASTSHLPSLATVLFRPSHVKELTGVDIAESKMEQILQNLGLSISKTPSGWEVSVPSYRVDISLNVDLVEEIIRVNGYNNIPGEKMMAAITAGTIEPHEALSLRMAQFFAARGYHETINYSFVDPAIQDALYPNSEAIKLLNPISPELSSMRLGLLPGLLAAMIYNFHRQQNSIKFFEQGVIFEIKEGNVVEHPCIGGLLSGDYGYLNWSETARKFDYFDLKGDLQALFASLHLPNPQFESIEDPSLHPGKSAKIMINQREVGRIGVLHPKIADCFNIQDEVLIFELRLSELPSKTAPSYKAISKFPQIRRDLSMLVDNHIRIAEIEALLQETLATTTWLKAFDVFDVYTGETIPEGKKSLAIALTLQDDKRTLVDNEINAVMDAIIKRLTDNFAINLRD